MQTKRDSVKQALEQKDFKKAISIASKFSGKDMNPVKDAQLALQNPSFYKQIGKNPEQIIEQAIAYMCIKFSTQM
jgi:hypothetical protein